MSTTYKAVQWNAHKRTYDVLIALLVLLFLITFILVSKLTQTPPNTVSDEILFLRATAVCAMTMLTITLCIGPLARIDKRFNILLYNRRHLGVATFLVAMVHAGFASLYYGGLGVLDPATALHALPAGEPSPFLVPFTFLGLLALLILFLMAATSHDFWLKNLTPGVWKALHMLVYVAFALALLHVAFGALQAERSPVNIALTFAAALLVVSLHVIAGTNERSKDLSGHEVPDQPSWIPVATTDEIPNTRAKVVCLQSKERVAIFNNNGKLSAISNVCAHQMGPLGEGKIIDGCVTCPWHGYQYLPESGSSPPPHNDKVPTYQLRVEGKQVFLNPEPNPPGTPAEPATIPPTEPV